MVNLENKTFYFQKPITTFIKEEQIFFTLVMY